MPSTENSEVLIIGSGGREHALGWKISQSRHVARVYFAPGNGGTSENLDIKQNDVSALVSFARSRQNMLTIVGPEEPLSLGIADRFRDRGLRIFGPIAAAAKLESSKVFAKEFMTEAGIPTAKSAIFSDSERAKDYVSKQAGPVVVKADGLAAGKGVIVCDDAAQALQAIDDIMVKKAFGDAGGNVVIEERLAGEEASFIAMCDGETMIPLASSQDHKRVFDGDKGPNTGGMGAYSPAPVIDDGMHELIVKGVMGPAIRTMKSRGTPFTGFLYAGIMVEEKSGKPYVLEFNARMGDPECQPIMMRMKSDLFEYVDAAVDGLLATMPPLEWTTQSAVCVVMAARGYPDKYEKGRVIEGLDTQEKDVVVFHAGTAKGGNNSILTNGGRVLGVTALGDDAGHAAEKAYSVVRRIRWGENGHHYRTDIAKRAIMRQG